MPRRLSLVLLVVVAMMLATSALAFAQTTTVPATITVPSPGSNVIRGQWDSRCVGQIMTVTDAAGIVIGTGTVQADGTFVINLTRPVVIGEQLTITGACGPNSFVQVLGPVAVPEAGTLLMLGAGLAGVAGYVGLRWRARK